MIARARSTSLWAACLLLASASFISFGCGRQTEGERCSLKNGDLDCNSELQCTPSTNLRNGADRVDRCCRSSGFSDARCTPGRSGGGTGGSPGSGGEGGTGPGGASGSGRPQGERCNYNSECQLPLVCKTQCPEVGACVNSCEYECNEQRDCSDGYICSNNTCLFAAE